MIGRKNIIVAVLAAACFLLAASATFARADTSVCLTLRGAAIVAQDDENTFLGRVTNKYNSDSVFNEFGTYGNQFNSASIWNKFAAFGSPYGLHSPHNKFSAAPPMLIKGGKVIGYLSANRAITPSISPNLLRALCEDVVL